MAIDNVRRKSSALFSNLDKHGQIDHHFMKKLVNEVSKLDDSGRELELLKEEHQVNSRQSFCIPDQETEAEYEEFHVNENRKMSCSQIFMDFKSINEERPRQHCRRDHRRPRQHDQKQQQQDTFSDDQRKGMVANDTNEKKPRHHVFHLTETSTLYSGQSGLARQRWTNVLEKVVS